ncbi:MAG: hypothetical protein NC117_00495 [Pseudoflavonifractor sp.]|nr:hypothetical protein [Pseudoflavonifractor sp.]
MKPAIYHKPSIRERHIVTPNYTYSFARWLKKTTGRTLCPPHRHIIDRLERARLNAAPVSSPPVPSTPVPSTPHVGAYPGAPAPPTPPYIPLHYAAAAPAA